MASIIFYICETKILNTMFTQLWFYAYIFSFPMAVTLWGAGRTNNNVFFQVLGKLLVLVSIVFLIETFFVADKWWWGLIAFVISYILSLIYGVLRVFPMLYMPYKWSIFEVWCAIGLPVTAHLSLYNAQL